MNDFLLQFETLYHVSLLHFLESIDQEGLQPRQTTAVPEHGIPATPGDPMQICFSSEANVRNNIGQVRGRGFEAIVCEIDPNALVSLRIAMDTTMQGTTSLILDAGLEPFELIETAEQAIVAERSLRELHTLACFDPIPRTAIRIREASDFDGPTQQSFEEWERSTRPPSRGAADSTAPPNNDTEHA